MMRGEEINGTGKDRGVAKDRGYVLELNARLGKVGHVANGSLKRADGDFTHVLVMILKFLNPQCD